MARTLLNEAGLWSPDAMGRALAHGDSEKVRAASQRAAHWKERLKMAQWWSDYLDGLRKEAQSRTPSTPHEGIQYRLSRPGMESRWFSNRVCPMSLLYRPKTPPSCDIGR